MDDERRGDDSSVMLKLAPDFVESRRRKVGVEDDVRPTRHVGSFRCSMIVTRMAMPTMAMSSVPSFLFRTMLHSGHPLFHRMGVEIRLRVARQNHGMPHRSEIRFERSKGTAVRVTYLKVEH